jgi:hypothetical protein
LEAGLQGIDRGGGIDLVEIHLDIYRSAGKIYGNAGVIPGPGIIVFGKGISLTVVKGKTGIAVTSGKDGKVCPFRGDFEPVPVNIFARNKRRA